MEKEQSVEPRLPQGKLHRVLRLAAVAHGLPDAVLVTGHALLRYIPKDADRPISPARVQDLADERGCDPRTIRGHIRRLEAYGLVVDRSAGGGRRMIQRRCGRIVILQGIDFSPMLAAAERIEQAALEAEIELDERRRLAARVSELKRQLRGLVAIEGAASARAAAALDVCPRRHRGLPLRDLAALVGRLEAAIRVLEDDGEDTGGRIFSSDRDDEIVRPTTTEKDEISVCRPGGSRRDAGADALRHITLDMLAAALPFDWRIRIERSGGGVSWASVTAAAYERAAEIGVTDAIWAEVQAELGRAGAAVLVLLADAGSLERQGAIRSPAAWVRAMAARAETGPLRLNRNLFGLLHRPRGGRRPLPHPHRALSFPDLEEPVMPRLVTLGCLAVAALGGAAGLAPLPSAATDYDIDCAVILCMAAGFPSEPSGTCSDAYDYMIDRITDRPPESPFDTCTMSDSSAYDAAEVAFARPSRQSRVGWICPEPAPIAFDETADYTFATPSCYPDAEYIPSVFEGGTWFLGAPVAAERIAYRFQISIPTGAGSEAYVSPVFLSNPDTGFSLTLTPEALAEIAELPTITLDSTP